MNDNTYIVDGYCKDCGKYIKLELSCSVLRKFISIPEALRPKMLDMVAALTADQKAYILTGKCSNCRNRVFCAV